MAGISIWQLAIIGLIVVLLFGTRKLRGMGGDLGSAIKGFKQALADEPTPASTSTTAQSQVAPQAEPELQPSPLSERR
ncbi:MAG: twin-arginine translocase TatA/TatE family subunit [Aeromonadaceae bacterium]